MRPVWVHAMALETVCSELALGLLGFEFSGVHDLPRASGHDMGVFEQLGLTKSLRFPKSLGLTGILRVSGFWKSRPLFVPAPKGLNLWAHMRVTTRILVIIHLAV